MSNDRLGVRDNGYNPWSFLVRLMTRLQDFDIVAMFNEFGINDAWSYT